MCRLVLDKYCKLFSPIDTKLTQTILRLSTKRSKYLILLAGGLGFEPRLTESESAVLPLDDPPTIEGSV